MTAECPIPDQPTPVIGRLIDAHAEIKDCDPGDRLFNHAILCQTGLPYRNPGDDVRLWTRTNGRATLQLEAGHALDTPGCTDWHPVGLPYGPRARLVLIQLSTLALRQQSPIVEVEDSMTAFARSVGLATSGRNLRTLREQLGRLAACAVRVGYVGDDQAHTAHAALFSECDVWFPREARQRVLWPSVVRFSSEFYESLCRYAVPLDPRAIGALKHSCRCLDIYSWLAHRLCRIPGRPQHIRWFALREQFAPKRMHMGTFKRKFNTALKQVLMVYPDAKVEQVATGLVLLRSKAPIPDWRRGLRDSWGVSRAS